jgi:hypothetical protein
MKSFNNYLEFKLQEMNFSPDHLKNIPDRDPRKQKYNQNKEISDHMAKFLQDFQLGKYNFLKQYIDEKAIKDIRSLQQSYASVQSATHDNLRQRYTDLDNHDYDSHDKMRYTSDGVEKPRNA